MEFKATLKNLRISARKVRLVTDAVRGKTVSEALVVLEELDKKSAVPVAKLIKSAAANAAHTENVLQAQLKVDQIFVGEGPTLKRFRPRAFGRAFMIRKRTSHVTVVLSLTEAAAKRSTKKTEDKAADKTEETKKVAKKPAAKKTTSAKKTTKKASSTTKTSSRTTKKTSSSTKTATKKPAAKKSTKKTEE